MTSDPTPVKALWRHTQGETRHTYTTNVAYFEVKYNSFGTDIAW